MGGGIRLGRSTGTQEGDGTPGKQVSRKEKVTTRHKRIELQNRKSTNQNPYTTILYMHILYIYNNSILIRFPTPNRHRENAQTYYSHEDKRTRKHTHLTPVHGCVKRQKHLVGWEAVSVPVFV